MATPDHVKAQMKKNNLKGVNKPKRTPNHKTNHMLLWLKKVASIS